MSGVAHLLTAITLNAKSIKPNFVRPHNQIKLYHAHGINCYYESIQVNCITLRLFYQLVHSWELFQLGSCYYSTHLSKIIIIIIIKVRNDSFPVI